MEADLFPKPYLRMPSIPSLLPPAFASKVGDGGRFLIFLEAEGWPSVLRDCPWTEHVTGDGDAVGATKTLGFTPEEVFPEL